MTYSNPMHIIYVYIQHTTYLNSCYSYSMKFLHRRVTKIIISSTFLSTIYHSGIIYRYNGGTDKTVQGHRRLFTTGGTNLSGHICMEKHFLWSDSNNWGGRPLFIPGSVAYAVYQTVPAKYLHLIRFLINAHPSVST